MTDYNFKPKLTREDYGWYNLENLPHFDGPEQTQFVTFRLYDSLPEDVVARLRATTNKDHEYRKRVEKYLDSGCGQCWLRKAKIASIVRDAIKYNEGKTHDLFSWVIMPNHGHILIKPKPGIHIPDIMHSVKSFSAQMANRELGRSGQFWQHESFDRYIRNFKHFHAVIRYIEMNPVKAGLCDNPEDWEFSSAFERARATDSAPFRTSCSEQARMLALQSSMTNWQIEDFLDVRNGRLHIDGHDAVELAHDHGTPLFVYSEPRIRHNIARLQKVGDNVGCAFKLCYAAKAMSTMGILRAIKDAGCDLEVNSGGELWKALKAGFRGDQLNFNGLSKEVWEIELAIENGVFAIQVDSIYELSLINETARRLNKKANVSLRLVPEIESSTHSGLQTALLTSKFGMMPDEAFAAFAKYKDSGHLNLHGIHLHVGSQNPSPDVYSQAFKEMFSAMLRIFRDTGIRLRHINLGGGFPVNYLRDGSQSTAFPAEQREMFAADFEPADAIRDAWSAVREIAEKENALDLLEGITLLLEPGRSIIADAAICLTTVRNHKQRPVSNGQRTVTNGQWTMDSGQFGTQEESGEKTGPTTATEELSIVHYPLSTEPPSSTDNWLLTDAGFNILLSMETYKWYYHLISAERAGEPHETPYKVAGPLCDGGDVYFDIEGKGRLPDHRLLPENVQPGEVLALLNCGAYSLAQASQYNARFLSPVVLTKTDGTAELIRRRDNFNDLIACDRA